MATTVKKEQNYKGPVRDIVQAHNSLTHRTFHIYSEIDENVTFNVQQLAQYYRTTKGPVSGFINSPGGVCYQALAIFDEIVDLGKTHDTEGIVTGVCMSAAVTVLQAFKTRAARPNATFMIHEVSGASIGNMTMQQNQLKEGLRIQKRMLGIVADRIKGKFSSLKLKPGVNRYLTAEEALELGLIDKII